ncbi:alpha/beta hydrolase-fold protein [Pedobacter deserti]|uniref:alpha/beta hydrolase-fold protein n=1 Tax=Pedobacter deserti TaxID=2817382 RepID=UPI0021086872|nr:alpha/beta hydrolase-fold protein [Pedobacter sp. SYSU D00382]
MKSLATLLLLLLVASAGFGQSVVKERLYSHIVKDTILYNVWLPYGHEGGKGAYPVIYLHNYGALSDYGLNVAAALNERRSAFPKSIVIELTGSSATGDISELVDFSYFRSDLSSKAKNYLSFLSTELYPSVERKYTTSEFRAYMGHSFFASYGNMLFRDHPQMFDAYMLFAPERLNEFQDLSYHGKVATQQKFYYVATGRKDVERRVKLNEMIGNSLKGLQSAYLQAEIIDSADHNSIADIVIGRALSFLFSKHFRIFNLDTSDLTGSYQKELQRVKSLYKLNDYSPERNFYALYDLGAKYKNRAFIEFLIATEKAISDDPLHVFNLGYIYMENFKDPVTAERFYRKSIDVSLKTKRPKASYNGYYWLATLYSDQGRYREAFELLEDGYKTSRSYALLYKACGLALEDKSLASRSRAYLKDIISNFEGSDLELFGVKIENLKDRLMKLK